jgi:hypothetical protein
MRQCIELTLITPPVVAKVAANLNLKYNLTVPSTKLNYLRPESRKQKGQPCGWPWLESICR